MERRADCLATGSLPHRIPFFLPYIFLPKGTYTLELWGMDENGHTTGPSTIYTVVKRPRWFETWTAYTAYAVMFLVLCICGFRLYAKHLRKKNAQLLRE